MSTDLDLWGVRSHARPDGVRCQKTRHVHLSAAKKRKPLPPNSADDIIIINIIIILLLLLYYNSVAAAAVAGREHDSIVQFGSA